MKRATSRGACCIYWWISGFFAEVRLWMLELLGKPQPITHHTRAIARFFALWGEMWRRPSDADGGRPRRMRAPVHRERRRGCRGHGPGRAGTARLQFPDLDVKAAQSELTEAVGRLHAVGNRWGEAIAEVALGRIALAAGGRRRGARRFSRATEIAEPSGDCSRRRSPELHRARHEASWAANRRGRERVHPQPRPSVGCTTRRACVRPRRAVRRRGRPRRGGRAGALAAAAAIIRSGSASSTSKAFGVHTQPLEALREREPDAVAAGEPRARS